MCISFEAIAKESMMLAVGRGVCGCLGLLKVVIERASQRTPLAFVVDRMNLDMTESVISPKKTRQAYDAEVLDEDIRSGKVKVEEVAGKCRSSLAQAPSCHTRLPSRAILPRRSDASQYLS
jgi:flagellar assembly factor FliW